MIFSASFLAFIFLAQSTSICFVRNRFHKLCLYLFSVALPRKYHLIGVTTLLVLLSFDLLHYKLQQHCWQQLVKICHFLVSFNLSNYQCYSLFICPTSLIFAVLCHLAPLISACIQNCKNKVILPKEHNLASTKVSVHNICQHRRYYLFDNSVIFQLPFSGVSLMGIF